MKLIEKSTGKTVDIADPSDAQAAFMSGKYGVRANETYGVTYDDGSVYKVKGTDLATAINQSGGSLAAPEQVHQAELEKKYQGHGLAASAMNFYAANQLAAIRGIPIVGAGITEALPGIASKAASLLPEAYRERLKELHGIGTEEETRQAMRDLRELYPKSSLISEIGGATASMAAVPTGNLGGIIGKGATSTLGKAAQAAARQAIVGGAEGALFGASSELNEAALGDHELTAEKLLAAVGHGALYGAGTGAVLAGGGEIAGAGLRKVGGKLSPTLERMADEQAWRALSPIKKFTKEAEARAGGVGAVGRVLREEGVISAGDTVETILPKLEERVGARTSELAAMVDKSGARIGYQDALKAFEDVIDPLRKKALHEPIVASLEEAKESFFGQLAIGADGTVSVQDIVRQRKALDAIAYQEAKALDPRLRVAFLRDIRSGVEKLESRAIDAAETSITGADRGAYKNLKTRVQKLILAKDAAEDTASRMATNNQLSLGDKIAGGAGIAAGAVIGGPLGAIKGGALAIGSKLVRERGNATAAAVLGKLADLTAIRRTASEAERRLAEGVDEMLLNARRKQSGTSARLRLPRRSETEDTKAEYERRVEEIRSRVNEPYRAAAALVPMTAHAPNTASALADAAARTTSLLAQKLPVTHEDRDSLTPQATRPTVTATQMHAFNRVARVADDPLSILDDMKRGTLTADQVEVFKTAMPKTYEQMRLAVADKLAEQKSPLSPHADLQMRTLFGLRTGPLAPNRVAQLQANFAGKPKEPGQVAAPHPSKVKNSVDLMTPSQKAAQGK